MRHVPPLSSIAPSPRCSADVDVLASFVPPGHPRGAHGVRRDRDAHVSRMAPTATTTDVEFTIESWPRSGDRFLDVMYDKLGIAKALQGEMWSIACDRFAELVQGRQIGPLDVVTRHAS